MKLTKKKIAVAVAAGTLVVGGGTAYAFVVASAQGTSQAKVKDDRQVVTVTATLVDNLTPGSSGPATVTIHNPNAYKVQLPAALQITPTSGASATSLATVHASDVAVPSASRVLNGGADLVLSSATTVSVEDSSSVNQTDLLGATITLTYAG